MTKIIPIVYWCWKNCKWSSKIAITAGGVGEQNFGGIYFVEDGKQFL
jgi:hypothetical protein